MTARRDGHGASGRTIASRGGRGTLPVRPGALTAAKGSTAYVLASRRPAAPREHARDARILFPSNAANYQDWGALVIGGERAWSTGDEMRRPLPPPRRSHVVCKGQRAVRIATRELELASQGLPSRVCGTHCGLKQEEGERELWTAAGRVGKASRRFARKQHQIGRTRGVGTFWRKLWNLGGRAVQTRAAHRQ